MTDHYVDQLTSWTIEQSLPSRDKNRIEFLAVADDVRVALKKGYAIKTIWINLRESKRISFSYDTFLRHAKRLKDSPPATNAGRQTIAGPLEESATEASCHIAKPISEHTAGAVRKSPIQRGFTFNPIPNIEELF